MPPPATDPDSSQFSGSSNSSFDTQASTPSSQSIDPFSGNQSVDPSLGGQALDPFGGQNASSATDPSLTNPFTGSTTTDPYTNIDSTSQAPTPDIQSTLAQAFQSSNASISVDQSSSIFDPSSNQSYATPDEKASSTDDLKNFSQYASDETATTPPEKSVDSLTEAKGVGTYYGLEAISDANVRSSYSQDVAALGDDVGYSPERTELKIEAREDTSPLMREVAEYIRPIEDDTSRIGSMGSTNEGVNAGVGFMGIAGTAVVGASVIMSGIDIYTAPEGTGGLVAAQEAGSLAGAWSFGTTGAESGLVVGEIAGALAGEAIFPFGGGAIGEPIGGIIGAAVGGIISSMAGADVGAQAGRNIYGAAQSPLP